jgi:hypothetical protein
MIKQGGDKLNKVRGKLICLAEVIVIALLSGCNAKTEYNNYSWMFDYTGKAYSSAGILHDENGYLYYFDAETNQDELLCNNPSCEHKKETCSAYFEATYTSGIIENDKLLLITKYGAENYGDICIYTTDLDGSDRKKIEEFNNIQVIEDTYIDSDYVILSYYNQYDENMEEMELPESGIYVYDRNTGTGKKLVNIKMWNSRIPRFALVDDTLYFSFLGYEITKEDAILHEEDFDFFEENKVSAIYSVALDEGSELNEIISCDDVYNMLTGCSYIVYDKAETMYVYSIAENISTEISGSMNAVSTDNTDGLYLTEYNSEEKCRELFFYNYESGELRDCGRLKDDIILDEVSGDTFYVLKIQQESSDEEDVFAAYKGEHSVVE